MNQFNDFLILLDSNLSGSWWFPALLIGTGIFFTLYLRFPQFRYIKSAIKIVSGKNRNTDSDGERRVRKVTEKKTYFDSDEERHNPACSTSVEIL